MNNPQDLDPKKYTLDKTGHIRFDFLFSYWIVIWFLVYYFIQPSSSKIVQFVKTYMNPTIGLWIALLENVITFIFIVRSQFEWWFFFVFIFMMVLIKILPLYLLRNTKIHLIPNIISLSSLFLLYNLYLWTNGTNAYEVYDKTIQSFQSGNNQTPLFQLMHQLFMVFR